MGEVSHSGAVNKLAWAHPEFGQVLASCSADRQINIYDEQGLQPMTNHSTFSVETAGNKRVWNHRAQFSDSRDEVKDIEFAPKSLGLKLVAFTLTNLSNVQATCSLDGQVRIYEAVDVSNLSVWPLTEEFEADSVSRFCPLA